MERDRQVTTPELPAEVLETALWNGPDVIEGQYLIDALRAAGWEVTPAGESARLREAADTLNAAVDSMWNDDHRQASNHWSHHEKVIIQAQRLVRRALAPAREQQEPENG